MSVVSSELGVGALQRWISRGLWLLETTRREVGSAHVSRASLRCKFIPITVVLPALVMLTAVLRLCERSARDATKNYRTRNVLAIVTVGRLDVLLMMKPRLRNSMKPKS